MARLTKCLLVGHCGADAFAIDSMVSDACRDLTVLHVSDEATLRREATPDALMLINRLLDGVFPWREGTDLIRAMAQGAEDGGRPTMMLVSNYEHAQEAAEAAGAVPGFGKSVLYDPATTEHLRRFVAGERFG